MHFIFTAKYGHNLIILDLAVHSAAQLKLMMFGLNQILHSYGTPEFARLVPIAPCDHVERNN